MGSSTTEIGGAVGIGVFGALLQQQAELNSGANRVADGESAAKFPGANLDCRGASGTPTEFLSDVFAMAVSDGAIPASVTVRQQSGVSREEALSTGSCIALRKRSQRPALASRNVEIGGGATDASNSTSSRVASRGVQTRTVPTSNEPQTRNGQPLELNAMQVSSSTAEPNQGKGNESKSNSASLLKTPMGMEMPDGQRVGTPDPGSFCSPSNEADPVRAARQRDTAMHDISASLRKPAAQTHRSERSERKPIASAALSTETVGEIGRIETTNSGVIAPALLPSEPSAHDGGANSGGEPPQPIDPILAQEKDSGARMVRSVPGTESDRWPDATTKIAGASQGTVSGVAAKGSERDPADHWKSIDERRRPSSEELAAVVLRSRPDFPEPRQESSANPEPVGSPGNAAVLHASGAAGRSSVSSPLGHSAVTFDRMDGAAAPRVLESTPQRLAVGVRDAGLGWVEVRTHAAGSQVAAVVATSSGASHQAIAAELPSIREYLVGQHVRVDALMAEPFSTGYDRGSAPGHSAGQDDPHQAARHDFRNPTTTQPEAALLTEGQDELQSLISVRA